MHAPLLFFHWPEWSCGLDDRFGHNSPGRAIGEEKSNLPQRVSLSRQSNARESVDSHEALLMAGPGLSLSLSLILCEAGGQPGLVLCTSLKRGAEFKDHRYECGFVNRTALPFHEGVLAAAMSLTGQIIVPLKIN